MKIQKHWNRLYIQNRLKEALYRKQNADNPWLTPDSIKILNDLLTNKDIMLEFGSGRSTLWFAQRVKFLYSIEDNQSWFSHVKGQLELRKTSNVDYRFCNTTKTENPSTSEYTKIFSELADSSVDVVLVDGSHRGYCAVAAIKKVKSNGFIILDNVNWELPSNTVSPTSKHSIEECEPIWKEYYYLTQHWRRIWTSNGVTDTAIYFKPNS